MDAIDRVKEDAGNIIVAKDKEISHLQTSLLQQQTEKLSNEEEFKKRMRDLQTENSFKDQQLKQTSQRLFTSEEELLCIKKSLEEFRTEKEREMEVLQSSLSLVSISLSLFLEDNNIYTKIFCRFLQNWKITRSRN